MNLPVDAIEFLDVFFGFLNNANKDIWNENNLPIIMVNGFVTGDDDSDCKERMVKRANELLPNLEC